jgi:hypothetical protein
MVDDLEGMGNHQRKCMDTELSTLLKLYTIYCVFPYHVVRFLMSLPYVANVFALILSSFCFHSG